jgi:hypothetical protein
MLSEDAVLQEAAHLHSFIESLVNLCSDLRDDYPVFAPASERFFAYALELGRKTQQYLEIFPAFYAKSKDQRSAHSKLQKLFSLKTAWEALHAFVKPALDADSLHLPSSLITAFEDIVNSVEEWHEYKFILFQTSEANYLQIPSGMAREVANEIAESVGYERFDPTMGLVGIPYSQTSSVFLNCVLPHEFAHFIYQESSDMDLENRLDGVTDATLNHLDDESLSWCIGQLKSWLEETFCDLMAICMIGPAFSLSLIRLTAATAMVGRPDGEPAVAYGFRDGYPPDAVRLHFHQKLLKRLGWWPLLENWGCSSVRCLEKCATWSPRIIVEGGDVPPEVDPLLLLQSYQTVCEWLIEYCAGHFVGTAETIAAFTAQEPKIAEYLKRAIVPSTIVVDGQEHYPSPVVLLNAGVKFLLEDLSTLIENIAGENAKSVRAHSKIGSRVELWILKAIEDHRLLVRQQK